MLALAVVLAAAACGGEGEAREEPASHAVPPGLVEEAEERGTVLVVVELAAEGAEEIAEAQEALLAELGEHGEAAGRPERVPQLGVRVDAQGLAILGGSPYVLRVEANEPEPPGS